MIVNYDARNAVIDKQLSDLRKANAENESKIDQMMEILSDIQKTVKANAPACVSAKQQTLDVCMSKQVREPVKKDESEVFYFDEWVPKAVEYYQMNRPSNSHNIDIVNFLAMFAKYVSGEPIVILRGRCFTLEDIPHVKIPMDHIRVVKFLTENAKTFAWSPQATLRRFEGLVRLYNCIGAYTQTTEPSAVMSEARKVMEDKYLYKVIPRPVADPNGRKLGADDYRAVFGYWAPIYITHLYRLNGKLDRATTAGISLARYAWYCDYKYDHPNSEPSFSTVEQQVQRKPYKYPFIKIPVSGKEFEDYLKWANVAYGYTKDGLKTTAHILKRFYRYLVSEGIINKIP